MKSFRTVSLRGTRWVVAAALAVTSLVPLAAQAANGGSAAGSACDTSPDKCYSFSMSVEGTPGPGDDALYTGTLKNLSGDGSGLQLGSASITWSPSDAFYRVTAGSVTVSPSSSSATPSQQVDGDSIELRNLNAAPGATVTFSFRALALRAVDVTWSSAAKQANQFLGVGNDLTQLNEDPTTSVSGSCSGSLEYNAYGCAGFPIAQGGTVCTGDLDSDGAPSAATGCVTFPPVPGATGFQLMALRSYLGGDGCPVDGLLDCTYVVQLLNKLNTVYAGEFAATMNIDCGDLCAPANVVFQEDELSGTREPMGPCAVVEAPELVGGDPIASPLTGSTACFTDNGDSMTVSNVTFLNDYKVMVAGLGL